MLRAAALRPINVIDARDRGRRLRNHPGVVVGALDHRDLRFAGLPGRERPIIFQRKVLGREERAPKTAPNAVDEHRSLPERRARWLPRGETRQKVEAALDVYRKVVAAIETSDDVTRPVLDDAVPRLHAAADRLVDVAQGREKAAEVATRP